LSRSQLGPLDAANGVFLTCNEIVNHNWSSTIIQVLDYYPHGGTRNVSDGQHEQAAALIEAQVH
jgi:hypothetical protein